LERHRFIKPMSWHLLGAMVATSYSVNEQKSTTKGLR
jgi:hypothetical protein